MTQTADHRGSSGSTTHAPLTHRLPLREKLSYGAGDLASNLSWNMVGSFLLFFYTDVALLPAAVVGTMFLVARILDAAIDPLFGFAVDRTSSKYGKARPYILYASFPFAAFGVSVFWMPNLSQGAQLTYAFITFFVLGILYSAVNVPYAALMPMMTRDTHQRMQLGSFRGIGGSVGTILVTASVTPLVIWVGGSETDSTGWLIVAATFSAVGLILLLVTFKGTTERVALSAAESRAPLRIVLRNLIRNRPWIVTFIFSVTNFVRLGILLSSTVYFALAVLKAPWAISVMLPMVSGAMIVGGFLAPKYYARFGKRRGNQQTLVVSVLLWAALPFTVSTLPLFLAVYISACVTVGLSMVSIFTMVADSVDYEQWKFGTRNDGVLSSGISFATKLGMAFGTAFVAYSLSWFGYSPGNVTESAADGIGYVFFYAPLVLLAIQLVAVSFYNLDDKYERIVADLAERRTPEA